MNIILDTNILRRNFKLMSSEFNVVSDYLSITDSRIYLPKIVFEEIVELYGRYLQENYEKYQRALKNFNKALLGSGVDDSYEFDINQEIEKYKNRLELILVLDDETIIDYKDNYLQELVTRAVKKKKPLGENGQQFRDGLLWLSLLDFAESTKEKRVIFISDNIKDFGDSGSGKLNGDLLKEAKEREVEIIYYRSITDFIKEHASKIDFIDENWINSKIDYGVINRMFDNLLVDEQDEIERLVSSYIENDEVVIGEMTDTNDVYSKIHNFFVYELSDRNILLNCQLRIQKEYDVITEGMVETYHTVSGTTARFNPITGSMDIEPEIKPDFGFDFEVRRRRANIEFTVECTLTIKEDEIINYEVRKWEVYSSGII